MGRCSMAEWRWEQEDAAIIQKIMRGFLIRKEQKVTFKKVTTKGRFAPGVGGVSPPLDEKNIKFIYQVNRDTFSYYANITTYLTSSSIKLTLKNINYELEKENERILDYRVNKYDNGIEKKSRLSLVKHYDDYYKNQLHNNRDRAREIEKRIYKRLLCIK